MAADPRGRWFRVYARQVRQHPKFRGLSLSELGAWMVLRSEVEILDAPLADREEAMRLLRLRRGRADVLDRLIEVRLLDELPDGSIAIHDRSDHDRPPAPSDAAEETRKRKQKQRQKASRSVTTRDTPVTTPTRARPRSEAGSGSASVSVSEGGGPGEGLPSDDDSATIACRQLFDSGKWLSDREYVAAWEDMDHRYSAAWVQAEITPAFAACLEARGKVLPWDLKRMTEQRLAERSRAEERAREDADRRRSETQAAAQTVEVMSPEEQERQGLFRRALALWRERGMRDKVPTDVEELREWIDHHEQGAPA